jgi:hypothetical protein
MAAIARTSQASRLPSRVKPLSASSRRTRTLVAARGASRSSGAPSGDNYASPRGPSTIDNGNESRYLSRDFATAGDPNNDNEASGAEARPGTQGQKRRLPPSPDAPVSVARTLERGSPGVAEEEAAAAEETS